MDKEKNEKENLINEKESLTCPLSKIFIHFRSSAGRKSKFFQHLTRSRVELLKAVKSLLDDKIEYLEKKEFFQDKKKMTKIKLE